MTHNRDTILATVLFSSTFTLLVVLCIAKFIITHRGPRLDDCMWQTPTKQIVSSSIDGAKGRNDAISPFDPLFRAISEEHNTDWLLMSAIAYAESRFNPQAKSHNGARGLMQVMPRSAAEYGVSADMLHDPESNIWVANMIFNHIGRMLSFPEGTHMRDKVCMVLAAYNCGVGRIFDAQRIARSEGHNPYRWSVISRNLYRLNLREYFTSEHVYHGRFSGAPTTVAYIDTVLTTYDRYRRMNSDAEWSFAWQ